MPGAARPFNTQHLPLSVREPFGREMTWRNSTIPRSPQALSLRMPRCRAVADPFAFWPSFCQPGHPVQMASARPLPTSAAQGRWPAPGCGPTQQPHAGGLAQLSIPRLRNQHVGRGPHCRRGRPVAPDHGCVEGLQATRLLWHQSECGHAIGWRWRRVI